MSILDDADVRQTGRERFSDFGRSPVLESSCQQTGEIKLHTTDRNTEFVLRVVVGLKFWANQAQYPEAYRHARRALLHRMYGNTLGQLSELRKAIYDGDASAALSVCDRIQSDLTEETP